MRETQDVGGVSCLWSSHSPLIVDNDTEDGVTPARSRMCVTEILRGSLQTVYRFFVIGVVKWRRRSTI
jgi:hypothetical protein